MEEPIRDYLRKLEVGTRQTYRNLTVFPLLGGQPSGFDYLTLDQALEANLVQISEIGQGGSVHEIQFVNKSPLRVLILDGEELVGAKQNRVVNTTILVEGNASMIIPVTCVEAGRWNYRSASFHSEERILCAELRAMKAAHVHESIRGSGDFRSDQGAIWNGIEDKARRRQAVSPSMAMSEIFEKEMPSIQDYLGHFQILPGQVGACFAINGRVAGLDCFSRPETCSGVFKKLMGSYILDAVDWLEQFEEREVPKELVEGFLQACQESGVNGHPSVGLGTDCRLESGSVTGFALTLDGEVLHLSAFSRREGEQDEGRGARMARSSSRRRNHR